MSNFCNNRDHALACQCIQPAIPLLTPAQQAKALVKEEEERIRKRDDAAERKKRKPKYGQGKNVVIEGGGWWRGVWKMVDEQ